MLHRLWPFDNPWTCAHLQRGTMDWHAHVLQQSLSTLIISWPHFSTEINSPVSLVITLVWICSERLPLWRCGEKDPSSFCQGKFRWCPCRVWGVFYWQTSTEQCLPTIWHQSWPGILAITNWETLQYSGPAALHQLSWVECYSWYKTSGALSKRSG